MAVNGYKSYRTYRQTRRRLFLLLGLIALAIVLWALQGRGLFHTSASESDPGEVRAASAGGPSDEPDDTGVAEETRYRVLLDAGHGGVDPGAEGVSGGYEKDFTLSVTTKVADLLSQDPDYEVVMTRTDDTFIELEDRAAEADALGVDAFISIHGNTYEADPSVSGTETYYDEERHRALADAIHPKLVEALGFRDRGVKVGDWKVLTDSHVPAILIELGFLTNKNDESVLLTDSAQNRVAQAIVDGLKQYIAKREAAADSASP